MSVKTLTQLYAEVADNFRASHTYGTSEGTRLNNFLTNLLDSIPAPGLLISGAGVPVDYTDGDPVATGDGVSPKGGLYLDTTNGLVYRNSGSAAHPAWTALASVA